MDGKDTEDGYRLKLEKSGPVLLGFKYMPSCKNHPKMIG